jgi:hypothetical protein
MCMFSSPSIPAPPPPPQPPQPAPRRVDEAVQKERDDTQKRIAAMAGRTATIATGPLGLQTEANRGYKKLLGQ